MIVTPSPNSTPSTALQVLTYLRPRMNLSAKQTLNFTNLRKGYEGERKLNDLLTEHLSPNYLVLNDLLLQSNHSEFQIDTLIIGKQKIYPLEVKNYEGNFYLKQENWYSASSGNEIRNPLHQSKRSELLLRNFLQNGGFNFPIEPYVIFIHPEFFLYGATLDLPVIFPPQINRFIKKLNAHPFKQTNHQKELAQYFGDSQLQQSSHERLPDYDYTQLRKGIVCEVCSQFLTSINIKKVICKNCRTEQSVESAIMRSVIEFSTLFPSRKITTNSIHAWCHIIESKKTIRRILKQHMHPIGQGKHTHYTF